MIDRHPLSTIVIGDRIVLCSDSRYTALALNHRVKISTISAGARVEIGNDVGMSGVCIVCAKLIRIGSEVLIGANVMLIDSDFHPIRPVGRRFSDDVDQIKIAPVIIGDNVFIGTGALILKGVTVGDDAVIAAGSVVTAGTYPAGAILGGNPARVIGSAYDK